MNTSRANRRFFAPEVVQTSAMDCGPAALKCLLEGFGIPVSYGRLREACQTDVDGTSIDTLEEVALQLGLEAEQIVIPADHLFLPSAQALPAIVVVQLPDGANHFVIVWNCIGAFVQIMDPATGRRWVRRKRFESELYRHRAVVPASDWREWAGSPEFLVPLSQRLERLGLVQDDQKKLTATAAYDESWRSLAVLDAATRMVTSLVWSGGLKRGREASRTLRIMYEKVLAEGSDTSLIPAPYWSVQLSESDGELVLRGAVLVRIQGAGAPEPLSSLSPDLAAALQEKVVRPARTLFNLMRIDGFLTPALLAMALLLAAGGVVVEAILLRGLIDLGQELNLGSQRLLAAGALLLFVAILSFLELPVVTETFRMGRRLEARLRVSFYEKIPRLGDRYFGSRPLSDMAERSHSVHTLRMLPDLTRRFVQAVFELLLTAAGIVWLAPGLLPIVTVAVVLVLVLPFAVQPLLTERDLRFRTHLGALSGFYFDALVGLVPIRTHGAERAMRREHESLLVEWTRAGLGLQRISVTAESISLLTGSGLVALLLFTYLAQGNSVGGILLLVFWALNLPVLGQEIAFYIRQYPERRNVLLRLLEPLGAPEETSDAAATSNRTTDAPGVRVSFRGVSVRATGHTILEEIDLEFEPGEHVAIVGPSGAGKSSLAGILLGWHRPGAGEVVVDGVALDFHKLEQLRRETAWTDPTVQLWNRSLLKNLRYGLSNGHGRPLADGIAQADLKRVLQKLPAGLQTPLGEGGGLLSGGEGQRVRFARALLHPNARLVILDEPFRGLDREQRHELLRRARALWADATLLCITHDVSETLTFNRVLVIEGGQVIEDGDPAELQERGSRYHDLLSAEEKIRHGLWSSKHWRRVLLEQGRLAPRNERV